MKARVMADGRVSLPAELRRRHGLSKSGEVIVEDHEDSIVLRTLDDHLGEAMRKEGFEVVDAGGLSPYD